MRLLPSFLTAGLVVSLGACGLDLGGLGEVGDDGGASTLDGSNTLETSSGGSSGSGSGTSSGSGSGGSSGSTSGSGGTSGSGSGSGSTSGSGSGGGSGSSSGSGSGGTDGGTDGTVTQDSGSAVDSSPPDDATLKDSSAPPDSSSSVDSGSVDSGTPDVGVVDSGLPDTGAPDTGTPCTTANGCYTIPTGWTLVPFASTQTVPCPSGYTAAQPQNVVEGPEPSSECTCGACSITTQPTCTGAVGVDYDLNITHGSPGTCGSTSTPATMSNSPAGTCLTDMYTGKGIGGVSYKSLDFKLTPPTTVTGGVCVVPGSPANNLTYAAEDRVCTPDSAQSGGCVGSQCTPAFPTPYQVCITNKTGAATCPGAPFTAQHLVGTGVSPYTCSSCPCNVTATCNEGGVVDFYTDTGCTQGELGIQADGACLYSNAASDTYQSYKYVAAAPSTVGCQNNGPSSAVGTVSLTGEQTICCTP